jgi:hypothetical protein
MTTETETPQSHAEKHPYFRRLDDDTVVDEVHITTIPRFKESGLSGDEWRFHARVEFRRKGVLVGYEDHHSITKALAHIARFAAYGAIAPADLKFGYETEDPKAHAELWRHLDEDFCAQIGCAEPWTVEYRMIKTGCGRCGVVEDIESIDWKNYRRRFCDKHANRGDSDLDDSDRNYIRVER